MTSGQERSTYAVHDFVELAERGGEECKHERRVVEQQLIDVLFDIHVHGRPVAVDLRRLRAFIGTTRSLDG